MINIKHKDFKKILYANLRLYFRMNNLPFILYETTGANLPHNIKINKNDDVLIISSLDNLPAAVLSINTIKNIHDNNNRNIDYICTEIIKEIFRDLNIREDVFGIDKKLALICVSKDDLRIENEDDLIYKQIGDAVIVLGKTEITTKNYFETKIRVSPVYEDELLLISDCLFNIAEKESIEYSNIKLKYNYNNIDGLVCVVDIADFLPGFYIAFTSLLSNICETYNVDKVFVIPVESNSALIFTEDAAAECLEFLKQISFDENKQFINGIYLYNNTENAINVAK